MSDTITLYEKCVHGRLEKHNDPAWPILDDATGEWNPGCPGGRERTFLSLGVMVAQLIGKQNAGDVWVEVTDE